MKSHTKGSWYHCDHCDYKNKDKRNTDSHMRTHSTEEEGRYECDKCGKKMRFSTQFKRHRERVAKCKTAMNTITMLPQTRNLDMWKRL